MTRLGQVFPTNSDKRGRNALFGTTVNPKKITYLVENKNNYQRQMDKPKCRPLQAKRNDFIKYFPTHLKVHSKAVFTGIGRNITRFNFDTP